jgi:hypothetical protein
MKPRAASRIRLGAGDLLGRLRQCRSFAVGLVALAAIPHMRAAEAPAVAQFRKDVQPILANYCYDCHGDGMAKGNVAFDELKSTTPF